MRKSIILVCITVFLSMLCACRNGHSKAYSGLEKDVAHIESQILETTSCDDLQMLGFGILGLRSDIENASIGLSVSEEETKTLTALADRLEALWRNKWNDLGCDAKYEEDDELYSSSDDDYPTL